MLQVINVQVIEILLIFLPFPKISDDDDDEPILLDPDPLVVPEDFSDEKKQKNCLGAFLQAVLYHYLALPFIKVRWVIIGE